MVSSQKVVQDDRNVLPACVIIITVWTDRHADLALLRLKEEEEKDEDGWRQRERERTAK